MQVFVIEYLDGRTYGVFSTPEKADEALAKLKERYADGATIGHDSLSVVPYELDVLLDGLGNVFE